MGRYRYIDISPVEEARSLTVSLENTNTESVDDNDHNSKHYY